jgi:MFS family permease
MSIRRHRDFLRIWTGQIVSNLGDGVHRIAVLWWARQATGSNLAVVAVAMATTLPMILMAPVAGVLVDRVDRRRLMLLSDLVRFATSASLAVLFAADALTLPMVLVAAAVAAAAGSVFSPAYMASITMLVPADDRPTANSLVGVNEALAGILGPAIGGLLIGLWGTSSALWFDAGTFIVSLLLVLASRVPMPTPNRSAAGVADAADATDAADAAEAADDGAFAALGLVRRDRSIRDLTMVAVSLNTFVAPVPVLMVALAAGPLALGGAGFGLLEATVPLGMLGGFIVGPKVSTIRPAAFVALVVTSLGVALAGATTLAVVAALTFVAAGVGVGVANTILPTRFQNDIDPSLQGRVFALLGALGQVGRPVGLLLAAPLLAVLGPRGGLAVCGLCMLAVTWFGRSGVQGPATTERASALIDDVSRVEAGPIH